ncbi:MAG: cytidylate kinase-like family protein [Draconibacterium sp.]|nr:cytidylate kinase-like family protein [Draconibacterium sp.]
MENILMGYLDKRLKKDNYLEKKGIKTAGPVVTISREVGCNGLMLAKLIASRLNERKLIRDWRVLSKEIFRKSAVKLGMLPEHVQRVFKQSDKYTFDEILKAFNNKNYKSEQKIINTLIDVVRSFAIDGYSIIVGRAGHIIANDINNALHIRLTAPLEYRIKTIQVNNNLTRNEALHFIQRVENERTLFRKVICANNLHEELFDLTLNRASYTDAEILDIIEYVMDKKCVLEKAKAKIQYY